MVTSDAPESRPTLPKDAPPSSRKMLRAEVNRRYAVHLHMAVILSVCFGAALIATKFLLTAGVTAMWLRYSLALFAAYAAFLAGIRIWLAYAGYAALTDVGVGSLGKRSPILGRNNVGGSTQGDFRGGGGSYGGAGASASFAGFDGSDGAPVSSAPLVSTTSSASDSHNVGGNGGNSAGGQDRIGDLSDLGGGESRDLGFLVVVIAAIAIIAGLFGGLIYLIYMAPKILGDAAFAALLSGGLVRSTHRIRAGGWAGSAVHDTWRPFVAVLVLALVFALVAQHVYPDALTFSDVLSRLRS
jgi:hypothetical protein